MKTNHHKTAFKKWLDNLQQESWQLELIISGFVIYGLFMAIDPINDNLISTSYHSNNEQLKLLWMILGAACYILIFNLILHVFLRALWIGAIGLRYTSGEIEYKNLKYSEKFTKYLRRKVGSFDGYIEKLENYCSILFSLTFLLVFYVAGFFIVSFLINVTGTFFTYDNSVIKALAAILMVIMFAGGILTLIDFLTQGFLKKYKWTSIVYYPFYRIFSVLTLSFLYRPLIYNFLDNKFGRRLLLMLFPIYALVVFVASFQNINSSFKDNFNKASKSRISKNYYEDEFTRHLRINQAYIPSKIITTPYLKTFLLFNDKIEDLIYKQDSTLSKFKNETGLKSKITFNFGFATKAEEKVNHDSITSVYLNIMKDIVNIKIDSITMSPEFISAENKKELFGFETILPIQQLQEGKHTLYVERKINTTNDSTKRLATIPFWYYPK